MTRRIIDGGSRFNLKNKVKNIKIKINKIINIKYETNGFELSK